MSSLKMLITLSFFLFHGCMYYTLPSKIRKPAITETRVYSQIKDNNVEGIEQIILYENGSSVWIQDKFNKFIPKTDNNCPYTNLSWGNFQVKDKQLIIQTINKDKSCGIFIPFCYRVNYSNKFRFLSDSLIVSDDKSIGSFILDKGNTTIPELSGNWLLNAKKKRGFCFFPFHNCLEQCKH